MDKTKAVLKKMKLNILLLSVGRRVDLVRIFAAEAKKRSHQTKILATELNPGLSAACQVVDGVIQAPSVNSPSYVDFLLTKCRDEGVGMVIPTIDTELLLLAKHRNRFASEGIHLVISDENLVRVCRDKRLTANLFKQIDLQTPKIYSRDALHFPCFVKPYDGSCSVGASIVMDSDGVSIPMLMDQKLMFMEFIDHSYKEYTVDAYYDRDGYLKCFVPRQRIETRGGEVSKGVTRKNHVYDYLREKLELLKGARGCMTLQLFSNEETGRFAALEINPRFGGGYPLSYCAGANYPGWLIDEYIFGRRIDDFNGWEKDLLMLRYDDKVLVPHYEG